MWGSEKTRENLYKVSSIPSPILHTDMQYDDRWNSAKSSTLNNVLLSQFVKIGNSFYDMKKISRKKCPHYWIAVDALSVNIYCHNKMHQLR